jgi:hypothetical protein
MNRLARASGIAVSALTAATATILLLVPGHARLEFPGNTNGTADGVATSPALGPEGGGSQGGSFAGQPVHGLTVNGSASPSRLSGTGDGPARSRGGHHALSGALRPALPPLFLQLPVVTSVPGPAGTIGDPGGALYARTPIGDCSGVPGTIKNDYVIAYDTVARHWSNAIQLDSDCGSQ